MINYYNKGELELMTYSKEDIENNLLNTIFFLFNIKYLEDLKGMKYIDNLKDY